MQSEIKQWGNSAAVRLSKSILAQAGLDVTSQINISVMEGRIVIEAAVVPESSLRLPFTEAELLVGLTAHTAHSDELAQLTGSETDA